MTMALCCLAGCPKPETTVTTPEGDRATVETDRSGDRATVTIESKDGETATMDLDMSGDETTMTIQSEDGDTKIEFGEDVDLSELDVEIYPGATAQSGGTIQTGDMGPGGMRIASLTTPDSFDDVAKFYKSKYGEGALSIIEQPGSLMLAQDEATRTVSITVTRDEDADETNISITIVPKGG